MMKLLVLLSAFLITCGQPGSGENANSLLIGDEGETQIPTEFLEQVCGGRTPEFQRNFKIYSPTGSGGGRFSGTLEEGQYRGKTLRSFAGQKGTDGILYIEEKGEEGQFNVAISVCPPHPIRGARDFRIDVVGLSIKTNNCPPYADINYATVYFYRETAIDYYGRPGEAPTEFNFSALRCR